MKNKVKELLTQIAAEQPIEPLQGEDESWIEAGKKPLAEDVTPPIEFIDKVNEIWRKAESREGRKKLGIRELDAIKDELEEFKEITFKEYGIKLTDEQAYEQGSALLRLTDCLIKKLLRKEDIRVVN